jgi:hypothetical protein
MRRSTNKPRPFLLPRTALLGTIFAIFVVPPTSLAQSASPQAAANPVPAAPGAPATQAPSPDPSAKPAAKPKHIITNDDLEPHSRANSGDEKIMPGSSSFLSCGPSCEQEARSALDVQPDDEAEWRIQIIEARRDLAADSAWRGLLSQGLQQSNTYCNFLQQQTQKTAPSGNDYRSRVQQAQNQAYFENMDKSLRAGMETTVNRMQDRIKEVQVLSPVRAALMYVQANHIFDRTCDAPGAR